MEFTFEYENGKTRLYQGTGEVRAEVDIEKLGWNTSPQFTYVAKRVYEEFNRVIIKLSKEDDQKNLVGKLTLDLKNL